MFLPVPSLKTPSVLHDVDLLSWTNRETGADNKISQTKPNFAIDIKVGKK